MPHDGWVHVHANHVVLAAGGIGSLWRETTNPIEATGDGLALAARAGARLADLEFMQFHPTALLPAGYGDGAQLPLLTEALRGAGALLLDAGGQRFMPDEHPLAELAPRDVVARAIARRTAAGEPVFLDLRPALDAKGEASFPAGADAVPPARLRAAGAAGADRAGGALPHGRRRHRCARPHQRRAAVGVRRGGCTGVHGANRLASNSLLEGLVFGQRVAEDIAASGSTTVPVAEQRRPMPRITELPVEALDEMRTALRGLMAAHVGIVRSGESLRAAAWAWPVCRRD